MAESKNKNSGNGIAIVACFGVDFSIFLKLVNFPSSIH